MGETILITGGSRSGKSGYAQRLAEAIPAPRTFIATCPVLDEEMRARIRRHKEDRARQSWRTIEETLDLAGALRSARESRVVLVDCLTLWINNLMFAAEEERKVLSEDEVAARSQEVLAVCAGLSGTVILVTNEAGMGIIPENALARRFRDLAGRCNQVIAARASTVTLLVAGLPLELKKTGGQHC